MLKVQKILFVPLAITLSLSLLAGTAEFAFAAIPINLIPAPIKCSISTWNTSQGISGGCTCYVAERFAAMGLAIPNWNDAGQWWSKASNSSTSNGWKTDRNQPRQPSIAAFDYGHVAYVASVSWVRNEQQIEVYKVVAMQRDFPRVQNGDNSVRTSSWEARRDTSTGVWETRREGDANGLQGYIYR